MSDVPSEDLIVFLAAAIFAFEQYQLGESEFESSIWCVVGGVYSTGSVSANVSACYSALDRDIDMIEAILAASQV